MGIGFWIAYVIITIIMFCIGNLGINGSVKNGVILALTWPLMLVFLGFCVMCGKSK